MSEPTVGSVIDEMTPGVKRAFTRLIKYAAGESSHIRLYDMYILEDIMDNDERKVTYFIMGELMKERKSICTEK